MRGVARPKFPRAPVEPFSREDVTALLKACIFMDEAHPKNRRSFVMRRGTADRDQAVVLTLLDTGLRASELCALKIGDIDQKTGKVIVKHGAEGGAKGGKGRTVYLGKAGRRALWRYLMLRRDEVTDLGAPLFLGMNGRALNRDGLRQVISSLGQKANVMTMELDCISLMTGITRL
jgi:integrase/recombinase XerD